MAMPLSESSMEFLAKPGRWTAADLDHLPENGMRYEVLNEQLIVNAAPKPRHQKLLSRLLIALSAIVPEGFWVLPGVGIFIGDDEPIPDLIAGQGTVLEDERGVPVEQVVLAVEIVSTSTTMQDRMVKPVMYAEAGIPNYWRIEINSFKGRLPGEELPVLFAYTRDGDGEYQLTNRVAAGRSVTLESPFEFTVDPATLMR